MLAPGSGRTSLNWLRFLLVAATVFCLPACGDSDVGAATGFCGIRDAPSPGPDYASTSGYVGLTPVAAESLAKSRGHRLRVVGTDNRCLEAIATDLRKDRVNIYVAKDVVAEVAAF